jgi:hypothetical protein
MNLSKAQKIIIGFLTIWPMIYISIFVFSIASGLLSDDPEGSPLLTSIIPPLHVFTMFLMLGLLAFYLLYLQKAKHVPNDKKVVWTAIVILGHVIGMSIFWYRYIWKEPKEIQEKNL